MRIAHGMALVTATFIAPFVTADASAQITRIDFQVVESPAFGGQTGAWPTERSTPTMCGIAKS